MLAVHSYGHLSGMNFHTAACADAFKLGNHVLLFSHFALFYILRRLNSPGSAGYAVSRTPPDEPSPQHVLFGRLFWNLGLVAVLAPLSK